MIFSFDDRKRSHHVPLRVFIGIPFCFIGGFFLREDLLTTARWFEGQGILFSNTGLLPAWILGNEHDLSLTGGLFAFLLWFTAQAAAYYAGSVYINWSKKRGNFIDFVLNYDRKDEDDVIDVMKVSFTAAHFILQLVDVVLDANFRSGGASFFTLHWWRMFGFSMAVWGFASDVALFVGLKLAWGSFSAMRSGFDPRDDDDRDRDDREAEDRPRPRQRPRQRSPRE